jgi:hypothetical protein
MLFIVIAVGIAAEPCDRHGVRPATLAEPCDRLGLAAVC